MRLPVHPVETVAAVRRTIRSLTDDGRGWILTTVAFGWFLGLGLRLAVPALVPYIRAAFDIGLGTTGVLLSVLWISYALFQFPGGVVADRIGERNALVASAALTIVGLGACALARSTVGLFAGVVLVGTATGLYSAPRFTSLSDVFPDRAATAIGISSAAGNVGTVVLPLCAGLLAVSLSWRVGFAGAVPLFALAAVGLWFAVPVRTGGATDGGERSPRDRGTDGPTQPGTDGPSDRGTAGATGRGADGPTDRALAALGRLATALHNPRTAVFGVAMFLMSVVYQGFTSFYPSYLTGVKALPEASAAVLYSLFFAVGVVVQPISGAAADAIGARRTMATIATLAAVGLVAVTTVRGFWPLVLVSALLGVQLGFWPIAQSGTIDSLPARLQGSGFGLISTIYLFLAAGAPAVVGALAGRDRFDEAFIALAACALATVVLSLSLSSSDAR